MILDSTPVERVEAQAYRRQQVAFSVLTLFVLSILLLLHALFARLLGEPSIPVIVCLGIGFSWKVMEVVWLQGRSEGISRNAGRRETVASILGIFALAAVLSFLTDRDESPYFVLLAIPILQSAYHLGLFSTIITVVGSVGMVFSWNVHYFALHPPPRSTEYLECGMIAVIFSLMGPLVWYLVNQLDERQTRLYAKMQELQTARELLAGEEKLAAIGRLASGVAHEIRNPVAMITSALATASVPEADVTERNEMYCIAQREAKRLERLTTEFLTYARPSKPRCTESNLGDLLRHVAEVTRVRAVKSSIEVVCDPTDDVSAVIDAAQVEGALLNLALNAVDATPKNGRIELRSQCNNKEVICEVQNSGPRIPDANLDKIFEPFFTTKAGGTGLGLAIANSVAKAHRGSLSVTRNEDGAVVFALMIAREQVDSVLAEAAYGQGFDRR